MRLYAIINRHGLRFTMYAMNRTEACKNVMRMLGKRTLPEYISVVPACA